MDEAREVNSLDELPMAKNKYNARSVRPCKGGGILVEGTFDKPFLMEALCRILHDRGKCAEKLGVARLFYGDCDITLYRNGRFDVHRVQSTEQAIEIIESVKAFVQAALVEEG
jgi:ArsR family metal-binding transcriptional regulator